MRNPLSELKHCGEALEQCFGMMEIDKQGNIFKILSDTEVCQYIFLTSPPRSLTARAMDFLASYCPLFSER